MDLFVAQNDVTNNKMVVTTIKVNNSPITVEKKDGKLNICYENTILSVYDGHKIRELYYNVYRQYNQSKTEVMCRIEIIPQGVNSYVFEYPYKRRHDALKNFNLLLYELEPYMTDDVNQNELLQE